MPTTPDLRLSASDQRRADPAFVCRCALRTLAPQLPLRWPTPPKTPPSPKTHSRSHYQPPDPMTLASLDAAGWQALSLFALTLRLIDFSGLRPVLAAKLYRRSARGRIPFDPVSLFLLVAWQTVHRWTRAETLRNLADPRFAADAAAFGFHPGVFPGESGLRYFLTTLGRQSLNDLLAQSMLLIRDAGVIPPAVVAEAVVSFDGMIHDAAARLHCSAVGASCYQPVTAQTPRSCPATAKGQRGCACQTITCAQVCVHATPRDPDARFVWYTGSNRSDHPNAAAPPTATPVTPAPVAGTAAPPKSPTGEGRYGYRSLAAQLIDPIQRVSWTLAGADLSPATTHDDAAGGRLLRQVVQTYDWLGITTAVGDAGFGTEPFLGVAADLHIRRVVDLRADPRTDHQRDEWITRGYDDHGWPVCPHGYRLHPNGYDADRHRSKWCCRRTCADPPADGATAPPPLENCPYRDQTTHPLGRIVNVGRTFADGSLRLVRDVPYGSAAWTACYRRGRNAVEGRNAQLEAWNLKRMPVFGTSRAQATVFLADVWANLTTLARLIKEATLTQLGGPQP